MMRGRIKVTARHIYCIYTQQEYTPVNIANLICNRSDQTLTQRRLQKMATCTDSVTTNT